MPTATAQGNPWFGIVFFGSIPATSAAVTATRAAAPVQRRLTATALALHLTVVATTAIGNVPLNEDLAARTAPLTAEQAPQARDDFETPWNQLNLFRALASTGAFIALASATARSSGTAHRATPAARPLQPATA